jgi:hypothetical protein
MRTLACCLLTLVALPPGWVQADVYKWIDARGAVHYSSEKPADVSVTTRIDSTMVNVYTPPSAASSRATSSATTSSGTVPIPPPPGPGAPPAGAPQAFQPMQPMPGYPSTQPDAAQLAQWHAQCERDMWADCDDPRALAARYGAGYPPVVIVRPMRPVVIPTAPVVTTVAGTPTVPLQTGPARPTPQGISSRPRHPAESSTHQVGRPLP